MAQPQDDELARLYAAHVKRLFPPRLRGVDVADVWFVLLDANIAGCTQFLLSRGCLDSDRAEAIPRYRAELAVVLPLLTDPDEVAYAIALQELATRCAGAPPAL